MIRPERDADKSTWRAWAEAQVQPVDDRVNSAIVQHLEAWLRPYASLLVFSGMPGEPDLSPLHHGGPVFLTRTPDSGPLTIHAADAPREIHRWGYSQPAAQVQQVDPESIDIVLVPGAVFGEDGSRIGHGKGYYDQLLSTVRANVERVGVTVSGLVVPALPVESHDVIMTHLATENGVRFVSSGDHRDSSSPSKKGEKRDD